MKQVCLLNQLRELCKNKWHTIPVKKNNLTHGKNVSFFSFFLGMLIIVSACTPSGRPSTPGSVEMSADSLKLAESKMQEFIDNGRYAGISTLVIKDGVEVQRGHFGYDDTENQKPLDDKTIFRIFSMTKPVTAAALMTLYDEGKFKLDDKVSKYIPKYAGIKVYTPSDGSFTLEPMAEEITIRHLLTHTSGISYGWDPNSYVDSLYRVSGVSGWDAKLEEKMLQLAEMPLNFQPGTKWLYGLSIDVAGYLVEVLSGMPLDEYLKTRIFDPLGMDDTGFSVPEEKHDRLCSLYGKNEEGKLQKAEGQFADRFKDPAILFSGGGGLVSTLDDYAKFCKMLLNGGELDGVRILEPETVKLIMSDQLPDGVKYEDGKGYGLAGAVDLESGAYGWAGAASTWFTVDPSSNLIVITAAQLMPSDFEYADTFFKTVQNSIIE